MKKKFLLISFFLISVLLLSSNLFSKMNSQTLKEAMFYKKLDNRKVQCQLCFRNCLIPEGQRGFCRNRENREGKLYLLVYGLPCAIQVDPIEKEPAFHMLPGSNILCIGTAGCNFRCKFCHNWHMSMATVEKTFNYKVSPEDIVELAKKKGCQSLSFTYNEPTVFYEFMLDIVKLGKPKGLRTLFHTNGAMNEKPLRELLKYMDAVTVDLKGFTEEFYSKLPERAKLEPVLKTLKIIKEEGKHLEIVNLVIPTQNDNLEDLRKMCLWIKDNLGSDVPVHFNRFSPSYRLTHLPSTSQKTLEEIKKVAEQVGLKYIYIVNMPGHTFNSTFCPNCKKRLIHRVHFSVLKNDVKGDKCQFCGEKIPGIWE